MGILPSPLKCLLQHSIPSRLHQSVPKEPVSPDEQPVSVLPPPTIRNTPSRNSHNEGFDKGKRVARGGGEETGS